MYLGAHMSIAGGIHLACERAREVGANVLQVFVKNQRQWKAAPLQDEDARLFREAEKAHKIKVTFAHASYLLNLASPDPGLWKKSIDAFVDELERCESLGLSYLIVHPGSPGEAGEDVGTGNMIRALDETHKRTRGFKTQVLLETTAGQGATLGWNFENMKAIRENLKDAERLGFCLDTCHVFAAGYDIRTKKGYEAVMQEFDDVLGIETLRAFHLNDSKKDLNCRVDRHEHIGEGCIGKTAFRCLMKDSRFAKVPKVLETPKIDDWDVRNLKLLRSFKKR